MGDKSEEVATTQWARLTPGMKGTIHLVSLVSGLDGKVGDGVNFPAVTPWSVGAYMEQVDLDFGPSAFFDYM